MIPRGGGIRLKEVYGGALSTELSFLGPARSCLEIYAYSTRIIQLWKFKQKPTSTLTYKSVQVGQFKIKFPTHLVQPVKALQGSVTVLQFSSLISIMTLNLLPSAQYSFEEINEGKVVGEAECLKRKSAGSLDGGC